MDANLAFYSGGEKVYEGRSPLKDVPFPPGAYRVKMENALINYHGETNIVIEVGKITTINETLK